MGERQINLGARLEAALDMLSGSNTVADIGCDHGRLCCALLQRGACNRAIAADISQPSLEKAGRLCEKTGLTDRMECRLGSGFSVLQAGEADAAAMLGMGGTLMTRLLEDLPEGGIGLNKIVFQPMRCAEHIRKWLFVHGCRIADDRVVRESGRLYQIFTALPPSDTIPELPKGWPAKYHALGYTAFANRDPLLRELAEQMLRRSRNRLKRAGDAVSAETLRQEADALETILQAYAADTAN